MAIAKWLMIGALAVGIAVIALLVVHAAVLGGGTTSWILALVWTLGVSAIVGVVARQIWPG